MHWHAAALLLLATAGAVPTLHIDYEPLLHSLHQHQEAFTGPAPERKGLLSQSTIDYLESARKHWDVPGFSVAVVAGPKYDGGAWREELRGFGVANGKGKAVDEETLFAIASNSKHTTALSIGLLIDRGTRLPSGAKLDWTTKIADILPEWKLADEYASKHADIVDLMSMRTGQPSHDLAHVDEPAEDTVANLRNLKPSLEIRQEFQYNNAHYITLSLIVSRLSGQEYTPFVRDNFFTPLNMTSTSYDHLAVRADDRVSDGFTHAGINKTLCREKSSTPAEMDVSCTGEIKNIGWWIRSSAKSEAGAGGIILNAVDAAKWLRELLEPQVLPQSLIEKTGTPAMTTAGGFTDSIPGWSSNGYGLAQSVNHIRGDKFVWHTGGLPGQMSLVGRVPSRGIGVAILTNDDVFGTGLHMVALARILDDLLGYEAVDYEPAMFELMFPAQSPFPSPPANARAPSVPWGSVPGSYSAPGYGEVQFAQLDLLTQDETTRAVVSVLRDVEGINLLSPVFVAPFNKVFASHLVLTHFDGDLWNATGVLVFQPDTGDEIVGENSGSVPAVVTAKGVGMFGMWSRSARVKGAVVEGVEEEAETWFARQ